MIEGPFVMQRERIACPQAPTTARYGVGEDRVKIQSCITVVTSTDSDDEWATLPEPEFPGDSDEDQGDAEDEMDNENLFAESPTLTRLDEGDVELDMDEVPEWDLDEDDEEVSDSDSDLDWTRSRKLSIFIKGLWDGSGEYSSFFHKSGL
ncbi:hypothetical protein B0H14DRAFT_2565500 [Mycena olivaceomarginata]|nr:hypothetical protein B0H14DRAFT_2565500 [Mycena olivaceomarginata]